MSEEIKNYESTEKDVQTQQENEGEDKTYTQEQLDELLQRETDKRVSSALKKREEKLKQEMKEQIEKERQDAENLAKLSAEEREKELLERTKKEIEDREKALRRKELLSDTKDILYEEQLPVTFADLLVRDNAESTHQMIKAFKEQWQKAIDDAVNQKLRGSTPTRGGSNTATTKNPFAKGEHFNLTEQGRLWRENPEEAERLKNMAKN